MDRTIFDSRKVVCETADHRPCGPPIQRKFSSKFSSEFKVSSLYLGLSGETTLTLSSSFPLPLNSRQSLIGKNSLLVPERVVFLVAKTYHLSVYLEYLRLNVAPVWAVRSGICRAGCRRVLGCCEGADAVNQIFSASWANLLIRGQSNMLVEQLIRIHLYAKVTCQYLAVTTKAPRFSPAILNYLGQLNELPLSPEVGLPMAISRVSFELWICHGPN